MRAITGADADFNKKWAPDELKFITEDPDEKNKLVKKLYKERFSKILLKKSPYPCRPLTYFFRYPQPVLDLYSAINIVPIKRSEMAKVENELESVEPSQYDRLGIELFEPEDSDLAKYSVADYLYYYSPPLAKIARVYSTMKELMKTNGFILSKAQKYNLCWGFSKHRAQIKVLSADAVPDAAPAVFALPGLLAARSQRLLVAERPEEKIEVSASAEFHASDLLPQERVRRLRAEQTRLGLLDHQAG